MRPIHRCSPQLCTTNSISSTLACTHETNAAPQKPFAFDTLQLLRFVLLTILTVPPNYLWQAWLERTFPARTLDASPNPADVAERGRATEKDREDLGYREEQGEEPTARLNYKNTAIKWFVDCITLGAVANTVLFLVLMGFMKGRSRAEIATAIQTETIPIIFAGYRIWPLASVISFTLVPVEKRIVFLSVIGLVWGVYMSLVAARQ